MDIDNLQVTEQDEAALSDEVKAQGYFIITVLRDGRHGPEVVSRGIAKNLIVNTGKRQTWRQASGLNAKSWNFMRIGTSSQAANSSQTNLTSPVTGTLKTVDVRTLLSGTRTMQYSLSYPSGAGTKSAANIQEVVILNQHTSPGGSALARAVLSKVNKTTADKVLIQYRVRMT